MYAQKKESFYKSVSTDLLNFISIYLSNSIIKIFFCMLIAGKENGKS